MSRLESLAPELFQRVVGYLLDSTETQRDGNSSLPRHYEFQTALLRTNKALHKLCKAHLDNKNTWIMIKLSALILLSTPDQIGTPLWHLSGHPSDYAHVKYPQPAIEISIEFPELDAMNEILAMNDKRLPDKTHYIFMALPLDLPEFLQWLRINERIYSSLARKFITGNGLRVPGGTLALSGHFVLNFDVLPNLPAAKWRPILDQIRDLDGPIPHLITAYVDNQMVTYAQKPPLTDIQDHKSLFCHMADLLLWGLQLAHRHVADGRYRLGRQVYHFCGTFAGAFNQFFPTIPNISWDVDAWFCHIIMAVRLSCQVNSIIACIKGDVALPERISQITGERRGCIIAAYKSIIDHIRQWLFTFGNHYEKHFQIITVIVAAALILDDEARAAGGIHKAMELLGCREVNAIQHITELRWAQSFKAHWYDTRDPELEEFELDAWRVEYISNAIRHHVRNFDQFRWILAETDVPYPEMTNVMKKHLIMLDDQPFRVYHVDFPPCIPFPDTDQDYGEFLLL